MVETDYASPDNSSPQKSECFIQSGFGNGDIHHDRDHDLLVLH